MHFGFAGSKLGLDDVEKFLTEMGVEKIVQKNIDIKSDDIGAENTESRVIVLE